jgi:energy-coupling factor transport system permease protein
VPCVVMGYYTMSTTRVSEFIAAMGKMRVPRSITIPMSVMFRFFPIR